MGEDFGWQRESNAIVSPNPKGLAAASEVTSDVPVFRASRAQRLLEQREFKAILDERLVERIFAPAPLWEGSVTLPVLPDDSHRYRLVIAEFEDYLVDDDFPYDRIPTKKGRRMVFAEQVEL